MTPDTQTVSNHDQNSAPDATMTYGDYLRLNKLLDAQVPLSGEHDETLFIIQHQTSELWMMQVLHEIRATILALQDDKLNYASKCLVRIARIFEQMTSAWNVLRTLTPSDYIKFRDALGKSSGFQSYQYRSIEFLLGNRPDGAMKALNHSFEITATMEKILESPSLYEEALLLLSRNGFDIGPDATRGEWRTSREGNEQVLETWKIIYQDPYQHWAYYDLAEKLVDCEDHLRRWRFNHLTTVERIIGMKRGTGASAGVPYLRHLLNVELFPELWKVRTYL